LNRANAETFKLIRKILT